MSLFGDFLKSDAGSTTLTSLLGLGTGLVLSNQQKQIAKGEANTAKELADKQLQSQQIAYETAKLQLLAQQNPNKDKSNTGLYIGLGVGGVVILGLVVYLAVKK